MNLWLLISWMRSKHEYVSAVQDVDDVLRIVEKPWKWTAEFDAMQAEMRTTQTLDAA